MDLSDFLKPKDNPHKQQGNAHVKCNALYKTSANVNCYLTPIQAMEHARHLLQKAQLILDHDIDDAVVHVWSQGEANEKLYVGLNTNQAAQFHRIDGYLSHKLAQWDTDKITEAFAECNESVGGHNFFATLQDRPVVGNCDGCHLAFSELEATWKSTGVTVASGDDSWGKCVPEQAESSVQVKLEIRLQKEQVTFVD